MNYTNQQISLLGYFSSSSVVFITLQDIVMALVLGFFGAMGGYLFKYIIDRIKKKRS